MSFDIIVLVGPADLNVISNQLKYTKQNIIGYRKIFLISSDPSLHIDDCITIDEKIFDFDVAKYHEKSNRNGWYYQQLIKLYCGFLISGILENYLVIDADTFFLKPISFIENDKPLYAFGSEHHMPYFNHMKKLLPMLKRENKNWSGITHHMLFQTKYIVEIINLVETLHKKPFWAAFLESVDLEERHGAGASEYEIYFNYILQFHPNDIIIRPLKWINTGKIQEGYDYVSIHWYMR